eukprot:749357-Hanusia_phi.AAC.4
MVRIFNHQYPYLAKRTPPSNVTPLPTAASKHALERPLCDLYHPTPIEHDPTLTDLDRLRDRFVTGRSPPWRRRRNRRPRMGAKSRIPAKMVENSHFHDILCLPPDLFFLLARLFSLRAVTLCDIGCVLSWPDMPRCCSRGGG